MIISIIAALGNNRIIGNKNSLPWSLPADMEHFRKLTLGKPIVIGQKTFESIGKALPDRENIVLSKDQSYSAPDCQIAHSLDEAIELAEKSSLGKKAQEVMICGGASVYAQYLPRADRMYLTFIDNDFEGDVLFPEFDASEWQETERISHQPDQKNKHGYTFVVLKRRSKYQGNDL